MKRLVLLAVLVILAAGCGDDGVFVTTTAPSTTETVDSTTSTEAPTSSTEPPTSSVPESTTSSSTTTAAATTTTSSGPYYEVNTSHFFPPVLGGAGDPHGSGCNTPDLVTLPNGIWFGFVEAYSGGSLTFDLACFFTGAAACDAQIEDGEASTPADCLDFHIRNMNPATFVVPIAPGWRVWYVDMLITEPTEIPASSWPSADSFQDCPSNWCGVWLYVNGGRVTALVEQYRP